MAVRRAQKKENRKYNPYVRKTNTQGAQTIEPLSNTTTSTNKDPLSAGIQKKDRDMVSQTTTTVILGSEQKENPVHFCTKYAKEIDEYLRQVEVELHPNFFYMAKQKSINHRMRSTVIDWLVLVHSEFDLLQETLFLAVSIIDRYLGKCPIKKEELRLVGVTAMVIASKYEEQKHPPVQAFVSITDDYYTIDEVNQMEIKILKTIGYKLGCPVPIHFLRRYSRMSAVTLHTHVMAKFLTELSLGDHTMLEFTPSQIAAASLVLATRILDNSDSKLSPCILTNSGHSEEDMASCMERLALIFVEVPQAQHREVIDKYYRNKVLCLAQEPHVFSKAAKILESLTL